MRDSGQAGQVWMLQGCVVEFSIGPGNKLSNYNGALFVQGEGAFCFLRKHNQVLGG